MTGMPGIAGAIAANNGRHMKYFSNRKRPIHLGPFPLERLARSEADPNLGAVPPETDLDFDAHPSDSLAHAMARFLAMLDTVRDGDVVNPVAEIPECPAERARHMKAACHYFDASMVGIARLQPSHLLPQARRNSMIAGIREELEEGQPVTYAAGVDAIYADILAASRKDFGSPQGHNCAIVILVEYSREPDENEPGTEWFRGTQAERAALLTANVAVVMANYIRMLGHGARAHTATTSEFDLNRLSVSAGLCGMSGGTLQNAFVGDRFGLAAVSTSLHMEIDSPLADGCGKSGLRSHGPAWHVGLGSERRAGTSIPFEGREYRKGPHPFESIKRVDEPTTLIDGNRIPRFPKRSDFFARSLFGDLGKPVQEAAKGAYYVMKSPIGGCARRALGALLLLQFGEARGPVPEGVEDPERNADNVKGASYYLSTDAVGISAIPHWAYYSHDAGGNEVEPYHDNAISMLYDQGYDTMEGASGDDWISVAQSMRAYLRFSLIGGVIAEQIRRLGYSARVHSVLDSDLLQPPLLLLSGLGEVSRIGEVILNPFLGPRLKSGVVSTSMPLAHDRPIDFGLQRFCESCNKCARECPSGAITAGPKLMYNGYEIWKSDAEKCARYRLTNAAGGMCGRCMKTCPWNLEGLFADESFRWMAINVPRSAKVLAKLDDSLGRGSINPVKKWWWDIELDRQTGRYVQAARTNERGLNVDLKIDYDDQTLAVYPADVMPAPFPVVQPVDREAGIERYRSMLTPAEYRRRMNSDDGVDLVPQPKRLDGPPPVFPVIVSKREELSGSVVRFELTDAECGSLPAFEAGAHVDVVIAPEYERQFSLAGDPADRSKYVLGILRETGGRGGSDLMYRAFRPGRRVFISAPRNHFPLDESAPFSLLMAGGIGATPLMAMAHRLHAISSEFVFHCSARSRHEFGFAGELESVAWADRVVFHFSAAGSRANLGEVIPRFREGCRLYSCGSDRYMDAVFDMANSKGWPEESLSREYFAVPEEPEKENLPFRLELAGSGRVIKVAAEQTAIDALAQAGLPVDTKCSDGLCGVCAAHYTGGEVDHRDFVLSARERKERILLCCSRAREANGMITIDIP